MEADPATYITQSYYREPSAAYRDYTTTTAAPCYTTTYAASNYHATEILRRSCQLRSTGFSYQLRHELLHHH